MKITDFIPKWTSAVKDADENKIETKIPYIFPQYQYDPRIQYFDKNFDLDFARVQTGVVTEAWNWNSRYFIRDVPRHFCETCNALEKDPAYMAITKGGREFDLFKKTLWKHFQEKHPEIIHAFDEMIEEPNAHTV